MTPAPYPDDPCLNPPAVCDPRVRFFHDDGVLFVTAAPPLPGTSPPDSFVAVWRHHADAKPYVFDRRIYTHTDLGHALLRLETLLGVNRAQFTSNSSLLNDAVTLALAAPPDTTGWPLATHGAIAVALDFDPADISDPTFLLADDDHGGDLDSEDECHNNSFSTGLDDNYEFAATDLLILDDLAIELTYGVDCCGTSDCCEDNGQCGPNEHCVDGECLPDECDDDSDCDADEHCAGGTCVPDECDDDDDCPAGSHCEGGECVDDPCSGSGECPPGQECIGGECEKPCNGDGDCPSGDECVGGVCEDCPGQCCDNDDCDDGNPCTSDQCRQGRCKNKCFVPPCIQCRFESTNEYGYCVACACTYSTCDLSINVTPDPACAGSIVDVTVSVDCAPNCGETAWQVTADPPWAVAEWPDGNSGATPCDESPAQYPLRAKLACDAPSTVTFLVTGATDLGSECGSQCQITVTRCVDLDVDSNNDGIIDPDNEASGTDDPIEDAMFSPTTPGKWLWRNNDDSDANTKMDNGGMEGSETDAGIINGTNDLVDLPELIIRPIPSGGFPTGSKLFLQTSDANSIRVFGCRTPTCAGVILGPGIPQKVEIPFDTQQRTFAVEGVQDGVTLTLSLIVEDQNGFTVCSDTVRITVIKLTAEWRRPDPLPDGTPITDANDHPSGTLGLKVFPDATVPAGSWNDLVMILVSTIPPVKHVPISGHVYDPDDPSADADEVDQNVFGGDNRSPPGEIIDFQYTTDLGGVIRPQLNTAKRPGDNHRVAATMKQAALNVLNNNNVPPSGDPPGAKTQGQVPLFIGTLTPLLTVWRELEIEVDSMAAADTTNTVTGTILSVFSYDPVTLKAVLEIPDLPDDFEAEDQHKVGRIDIQGFGSFLTLGTTAREETDRIKIAQAPANIAQAVGSTFILWDDDIGNSGGFNMAGFNAPPVGLPRAPDIGFAEQVYAEAYVSIRPIDWSHYDANTPFDRNVESNEIKTIASTNSDNNSSASYWIVHLTSALQGSAARDNDPATEEGEGGLVYGADWLYFALLSLQKRSAGGLIFLETIRDHCLGNSGQMVELEQYTVVHESGHEFMLEHEDGRWPNEQDEDPDGDFIMTDKLDQTGMAPNRKFGPRCLKKIRSIDYPPQP